MYGSKTITRFVRQIWYKVTGVECTFHGQPWWLCAIDRLPLPIASLLIPSPGVFVDHLAHTPSCTPSTLPASCSSQWDAGAFLIWLRDLQTHRSWLIKAGYNQRILRQNSVRALMLPSTASFSPAPCVYSIVVCDYLVPLFGFWGGLVVSPKNVIWVVPHSLGCLGCFWGPPNLFPIRKTPKWNFHLQKNNIQTSTLSKTSRKKSTRSTPCKYVLAYKYIFRYI